MDGDCGIIRQMIIITDGRSNIGINPVEAAAKAKASGITVSAIGIIDGEGRDEKDVMEVEAISKAGGGLSDYCYPRNLSMTLQAMTQKTVNHTLECIVSKQLKTIIGQDMTNIEPKSRMKVVEFIENYGERVDLLYAIVLDTSKSMTNKLELAKSCIIDLMEALSHRRGVSKVALISYPGENSQSAGIACEFTSEISVLKEGLKLLKAGGGTPTGPAILSAMELMLEDEAPAQAHYV
ncbi:vWA domain-containing protein [Lutispora saccharofermentans]|uniref:VWA domain-containing protein n=1 Tax=Lutispora saccharofermentans TaxID=3024236 RepID=A0ABT1NKC8_9FIRM|nr:VWA domain-containing protein [Lutispora saccharofermentans]MCQ1530583.1 VWA domain-containing protein [Lutispora saccharofermentans]